MSGARSSAVAGCLKACVARFVMILRAQVVSLFSVGPTVRPTGGTPASPAFLDGLSDGPPTPVSVGPTVRPTGGTPASPAFLDGLSDGPPTPVSVGPTVRPTGGTPPSPAFLDGLSNGPP